MHGKPCHHAVNPFSPGRLNFDGLRRIKFVEHGQFAKLRQALKLNVAVVCDVADDISGLIHRRDEQALRAAAAYCHDYIAQIVCRRRESLQPGANFGGEIRFVTWNGRRLYEFPHVLCYRAWHFDGVGLCERRWSDARENCGEKYKYYLLDHG